jgi:hypothetical protein
MLVCATSVLMHNVLSANNTPYLAAAGRGLQLALTVVIAVAAPISDPGLRMLTALTIGEILGFAPLAYWAVAGLLRHAGIVFHLKQIALTSLAAALAAAATFGAINLVEPRGPVGLILALLLAAPFCGGFLYIFGLPLSLRKIIIAQWITPKPVQGRTKSARQGKLQ